MFNYISTLVEIFLPDLTAQGGQIKKAPKAGSELKGSASDKKAPSGQKASRPVSKGAEGSKGGF